MTVQAEGSGDLFLSAELISFLLGGTPTEKLRVESDGTFKVGGPVTALTTDADLQLTANGSGQIAAAGTFRVVTGTVTPTPAPGASLLFTYDDNLSSDQAEISSYYGGDGLPTPTVTPYYTDMNIRASNLNFYTGVETNQNNARMTIDSSGDVGFTGNLTIDKNHPTIALECTGSGDLGLEFHAGGGRDARILYDGNGEVMTFRNDADAAWMTFSNGSDFISIDSPANVIYIDTISHELGIGTNNPMEDFHVNVPSRFDSALDIDSTVDILSTLDVGGHTTLHSAEVTNDVDIFGGLTVAENVAVDTDKFFVNATTGRVGIGTDMPDNPLTVNGNSNITGSLGLGTTPASQKLHVVGNGAFTGMVGIGTTTGLTEALEIKDGAVFINMTSGDAVLKTNTSAAFAVVNASGTLLDIDTANFTTILGAGASTATQATALGSDASASGLSAVALGFNSTASGDNSVSAGVNAEAAGAGAISLGINSDASGSSAVSIGGGSEAEGISAMAIGATSEATHDGAIALGASADAKADYATAIGYVASATGAYGTAIGWEAVASGSAGIAIGKEAEASASAAIALGARADAYTANTMVVGDEHAEINAIYLGEGQVSESSGNADVAIHATSAATSVSSEAGADLILAAGTSTGSADGGSLVFKTAEPSDTNYTNGTLTTAMTIDDAGNVIIGETGIGSTTFESALIFSDLVAPAPTATPTPPANTAGLYAQNDGSGDAYLRGWDASGDVVVLSPHQFDLHTPPSAHPYPWEYNATNRYLGKQVSVDMAALVTAVEQETGQSFTHWRDFTPADWYADQVAAKEAVEAQRTEDAINSTWVEIDISEAVEVVAETETEETVTEVAEWVFDAATGSVTQIVREVTVRSQVPTGNSVYAIKDGVRMDKATGKFFRRPMAGEVEIEPYEIKDPPAWMAERMFQ